MVTLCFVTACRPSDSSFGTRIGCRLILKGLLNGITRAYYIPVHEHVPLAQRPNYEPWWSSHVSDLHMAELESSKDCHVDCQAWPCTVVVPALLFLIVPVMETASPRSVKGALGGRKYIVITYLSANRGFLACLTCLGLFCGVQLEARGPLTAITVSKPVLVSDPPETRSPVSLEAINDPDTGKAAFSFDGREDPPVIRANPGEDIHLTYTNAMSTHSQEHCVDGPCMNMTNLHFHGLHVSPDAPQDDVITMMAMPGQLLHYVVNIPLDQPPGLYWYHTHPHGESYQQDLDGMSGAIVIDGMERYVPEVQHLRERILVLRDRVLEDNDPASAELRRSVEIPAKGCWASTDLPKRAFTVNGALRPQIAIAPGERQFWRIVNASPDLYADLQVDTEQLEIIALDGMPLSFHDPKRRVELRHHLLVPPAGRVEISSPGHHPEPTHRYVRVAMIRALMEIQTRQWCWRT